MIVATHQHCALCGEHTESFEEGIHGYCVAAENIAVENLWNRMSNSGILCPLLGRGVEMGTLRTEPYIWTTWLTRLLVGEESCEWGAWFKAHCQNYDKVPDTFDQTTWQMEHTALLRYIREKLDSENYAVFLERQNNFRVRSEQSGVTIGGQPDLIAIKGNYGLICDAKTGQERASNHVQVMIYMWAIPYAFHQYRAMTFDGRVIYRDHEVEIPASAINESFISNLTRLIQQVGSSTPLRKVPSAGECGFCKIASTECPERIEGHDAEQAEEPTIDLY